MVALKQEPESATRNFADIASWDRSSVAGADDLLLPSAEHGHPIVDAGDSAPRLQIPQAEKPDADRLAARIVLNNPQCVYRIVGVDNAAYRAKIVMLSHQIATLYTTRIPRVGTRLLLGNPGHCATVRRAFETGFTVEFDIMLEALSEDMEFC